MDALNNIKAVTSIPQCSGDFEDLFNNIHKGEVCHFARMVDESKFVKAASAKGTKKILEWIAHSSANIKLMTGAYMYFTITDPLKCVFNNVVVEQNKFGPQMKAPWNKENAAAFYNLLGSVLALYNCCKDSDQIATGLGLRSGFTVFGDNYSFADDSIAKSNGFLINMFLADKGKTITVGSYDNMSVSLNTLSLAKNGKDLKATFKPL